MMTMLPLVAALFALQQVPAAAPAPSSIGEQVRRAVELDSASVLAARWNERLRRDSTDRSALLGVATLARLTFDDSTAEHAYERLLSVSAAADPFGGHAVLGRAALATRQGRYDRAETWFAEAIALFRAARDPAGEIEALRGLSRLHERTRGAAAALELVERAATLAADHHSMSRGAVRCRRAAIWAQAGGGPAVQEARAGLALVQKGRLDIEAQCQHALASALVRDFDINAAFIAMRSSRSRCSVEPPLETRAGPSRRATQASARARCRLASAPAASRTAALRSRSRLRSQAPFSGNTATGSRTASLGSRKIRVIFISVVCGVQGGPC